MQKVKVLFFAEAVTLAHVARPFVLASALDSSRYDVSFAAARSYDSFLGDSSLDRHSIDSLSPKEFLSSLRSGKWLYTPEVLNSYVQQDMRLFEEIQPDIVVGDMRYSLGISAPRCGVPYVSLCNAYWSPYALNGKVDVPCYDFVGKLGLPLSRLIWKCTKPLLLNRILKDFNSVREKYGLSRLPSFAEAFTFGDRTFYTDIPTIVPTSPLPPHHCYGGAVSWAPEMELPEWWDAWREPTKPLIYFTPGSSGDIPQLPELLAALSNLPVQVVFAAGGRARESFPQDSAALRIMDLAPGTLLSQCADVVISNGGSPTSYQSLGQGTPVIGICSNLDQFLAMGHVEKRGAGVMFRSDRFRIEDVCERVVEFIEGTRHSFIARQVAREMKQFNIHKIFERLLAELKGFSDNVSVEHAPSRLKEF